METADGRDAGGVGTGGMTGEIGFPMASERETTEMCVEMVGEEDEGVWSWLIMLEREAAEDRLKPSEAWSERSAREGCVGGE